MSEGYPVSPSVVGAAPLERLRRVWFCLLATGVCLMLVGVVALGSSFIAALAGMVALGIMLVVSGVVHFSTAIYARHWGGLFLHLAAGVLNLIIGVFLIENPFKGVLALSLLVAVGLLVGGMLRIFVSVFDRFPGWGWVFLNGLISLLLGVVLWRRWPIDAFDLIGLFVGIELLFNGLALVMLGLAARRVSRLSTSA